ncbi:MAG: GNAT family N-acetyltransferase, partial [Anaerolineales bacterium]|nr:GNAT family N-acetyltransferase [Anaerolineales bacterium]
LLATAFNRSPAEMQQLLTYLQPNENLVAWGAWDGKQLAAQYSCLRHRLLLPHQPNPAVVGMSINMAVHPDYRGSGLVKQVSAPVYAALQAEGGIAGVGFSNAAGVKVDRHSKGYGYRVLGQMQPTLAWIHHSPAEPCLDLTTTWPDKPFATAPDSKHVCFNITPAWIYHRYACHPFRQYQFGVWETAVSVRGIVVFRPFRRGPIAGVSLLTVYGDDPVELLTRFCATLYRSGVRFIHALSTPQSPLRTQLQKTAVCLPLPTTRTPYFLTLKPLTDTLPAALFDINNWDCSGGDIL